MRIQRLFLTLLSLHGLMAWSSGLLASGGDGAAALDPIYRQECGSCHVPYPPRLLSAESWQAVMAVLPKHFGVDASLDDDASTRAIAGYLQSHARRKATLDSKGQPLLRITETKWFLHEHDEVPSRLWASPAVKSAANCGGCHLGADQGRFSEHQIQLPE